MDGGEGVAANEWVAKDVQSFKGREDSSKRFVSPSPASSYIAECGNLLKRPRLRSTNPSDVSHRSVAPRWSSLGPFVAIVGRNVACVLRPFVIPSVASLSGSKCVCSVMRFDL